jgi:hypothetical protein
MKNLKNALLIAAVSATVFTSCSKDTADTVAPVVQENNVPNGTVKMSLSVHVMSSSVAARIAGLSGASVTISNNGKTLTSSVDASGIASFSGLTEGDVSVFVKAPTGYLSFNTSGSLSYDGSFSLNNTGTNGGTDAVQESSNRIAVTLPKIGGTVKGKIWGDFDFNNFSNNTTIPAGVTVIAKVANGYEPNVFTTTTDGNGAFTFNKQLPEGVNVSFYIDYQTVDNVSDPSMPESRDWEIGTNTTTVSNNETKELGNITATDF